MFMIIAWGNQHEQKNIFGNEPINFLKDRGKMEKILNIHIEKLPEGVYLATSESVQGLVAQGRTVSETLEIARDVARKLLEAKKEKKTLSELSAVSDTFDYPLVIGV
eukprot:NODE_1727_length_557_cov_0.983871_g1713_i0.p2 GENE.NODE_1727_length_557_cov_0.983871_g1713_i0~~NODE_1727_length_557_cov_0.983871_g1713_i0.p2  ORF type:complete len:107 (+),score=15.32 NODE_1727_length_557_cov_0.983871_g1713_i0:126-446(+)